MASVKFGFTAKQIIEEGRVTEEDIKLVKTWLVNENVPQLNDEQVILFLLSCNNQREATKTTIKAFYDIRRKNPGLFDNRKIEDTDLQQQLQTLNMCILPERTDDGCVVAFIGFNDTVYYKAVMETGMKAYLMTYDAALYDNPPTGIVALIDIKGMGLMHLTRIRLGLVKAYLQYVQEAVPLKLKGIHILNTVKLVNKLLSILGPFIKMEVMELVTYHQSDVDMEWFYENCIPKRCLPEDYGGDLPSIRVLHQKNIEKLTDMQPFFDAEELQRHSIDK